MAYVAPTVANAVAGSAILASDMLVVMNDVISLRDNTGVVPPMVIVRRAVVQSIPHNVVTAISFDTEDVDTDGCFTATSTNITIKTSGVYLLTGNVQYISNATGLRDVGFQKNGTIINTGAGVLASDANAVNGSITVLNVAGMVNLVATDVITLYSFQLSTISLDITARASVVLLGRTS